MRAFFTPQPLDGLMRKVLHVGPCNTPGGMATVMHTLAEFPPEGWEAELLPSHAPGGLLAKWRAYRRARKELHRRCSDQAAKPDVVHVHAAADWSWRRKQRLIQAVRQHDVPVVLHLHSGRFDQWLGPSEGTRAKRFRQFATAHQLALVVLSDAWKQRLASSIGPCSVVENPVHPRYGPSSNARAPHHLLLMGRDDPVKGHDFAVRVAARLREDFPSLELTMTGRDRSEHSFVNPLGWVSEDQKLDLLQSASVLLLPSSHEGQPLVALEAAACGLPILAHEALHSLPKGTFTAGPSVDEWVESLRGLLSTPPVVDQNAKEHRVEAVRARWASIYDSIA